MMFFLLLRLLILSRNLFINLFFKTWIVLDLSLNGYFIDYSIFNNSFVKLQTKVTQRS